MVQPQMHKQPVQRRAGHHGGGDDAPSTDLTAMGSVKAEAKSREASATIQHIDRVLRGETA